MYEDDFELTMRLDDIEARITATQTALRVTLAAMEGARPGLRDMVFDQLRTFADELNEEYADIAVALHEFIDMAG